MLAASRSIADSRRGPAVQAQKPSMSCHTARHSHVITATNGRARAQSRMPWDPPARIDVERAATASAAASPGAITSSRRSRRAPRRAKGGGRVSRPGSSIVSIRRGCCRWPGAALRQPPAQTLRHSLAVPVARRWFAIRTRGTARPDGRRKVGTLVRASSDRCRRSASGTSKRRRASPTRPCRCPSRPYPGSRAAT